jgi:soluble lytic murein transglycosylase-like protein
MTRVVLLLVLLLPTVVCAAEVVILSNGFQLKAERHQTKGDRVIIQTPDGSVELAASEIAGFLPDESRKETQQATAGAPPVAPSSSGPANPRDLVTRAALQNGLPPELVHGVARVESNYNPAAVSPKGAQGVMQLMPSTARQLDADASDAKQNVEAGTRYLRDLLLKYQNDPDPVRRALAAYNAGPGAVAKYHGVPPYPETQLYVEKVLQQYWKQLKK